MRDEEHEEGEGVNGADIYGMKEKDTWDLLNISILKE